MIIGITGTDGAGKGTVVDYLVAQKGFVHCGARAIWIEEINKRGMEMNRVNMRLVANDLRKAHGNDFLVTHCLKNTKEKHFENIVIESIRAIAEAKALKGAGGLLLSVNANPEIRYKRTQERASESDSITFEEFLKHEALEMDDPDPHGMQKAKVMEMADFTITNNSTLEELYAQIESVFRT